MPRLLYERITLIGLCLFLVLMAVRATGLLVFSFDVQSLPYLLPLGVIVIAITVGLHMIYTLSAKKACLFVLIAWTVSYAIEYAGMRIGYPFGGHYIYGSAFSVLMGVPYMVPVMWCVFIYVCCGIVDTCFILAHKALPPVQHETMARLVPLSVADALLVVSVDLMLDPVYVQQGYWMWPSGGPYFSIPLGNFVGWFLVAYLVSFLFRLYEVHDPFRPKHCSTRMRHVPFIGYAGFAVFTLFAAVPLGMPGLMMSTVLPAGVAYLYFLAYKRMLFRQLRILTE